MNWMVNWKSLLALDPKLIVIRIVFPVEKSRYYSFFKNFNTYIKFQVVRKMKGVTINSEVDKRVTFGKMKNMITEVLEDVADRTTMNLPQFVINRDRDHHVFSRTINKRFRFTFNKRRILMDGSTLPFGYFE